MKPPISTEERGKLMKLAGLAAIHSYSPYSKFRVGAAVLGERATYTGVNIENASFPLGICAERSALSAAVTHGEINIRAIAIACIDAQSEVALEGRLPCGACRQWLVELAPDAFIFILGAERDFHIHDLLPLAFRLPSPPSPSER